MMFALCVVTSAEQSGDFSYWATATDVTIYAYSGSERSITVPDTINGLPVRTISDLTFNNKTRITNIIISSNVTTLGNQVFSGCYSLGSIIIPSSVTSMGYATFFFCSSLTNVSIPLSVTNLGPSTFVYCYSLNKTADSLAYVNVTSGVWVTGRNGNLGATVTIPAAIEDTPVTRIYDNAFNGFDKMTSISLPDSLTAIDYQAFSGCSGLTNLTIPSSVTSIGDYAFQNCGGLTNLTIPSSVTSIGSSAFSGCSGLTEITIPSSITSIGNGAFSGCSGLTNLTIPSSVTNIGENAFYAISSVNINASSNGGFLNSIGAPYNVIIPFGVKSIVSSAFSGCSGLTSITIPSSVTSIGDYAFQNCGGLTNITIPNSVTSVGDYAFQNCSGLTNITIPNSVSIIGLYAFSGCGGLSSVVIPNSVTSVGDYAFQNCNGLTSITIPDSVNAFGPNVFTGCSHLVTFNVSLAMQAFLSQYRSALGIVKLFNTSSSFPNNPSVLLSDLTSVGVLNSIATNPTFVMAFAGAIKTYTNFGISFQGPSGAVGPQGPAGQTGPQGSVGQFVPSTVLTNTAFLESLASNPVFVNALVNQLASNANNFLISSKALQTLSFPVIPTQTYVANKTLTLKVASSANLKPVVFSCLNPAVGTISNNILRLIGVGTTTVTASQAGNSFYNPVTAVQTLIVK